MKKSEYVTEIMQQYDLVNVLSRKEGSEVLRLRHKTLERDIVLRVYNEGCNAYEALKSIKHENLPIIYDALNFDDGQIIFEEFVDGITVAQILEDDKYNYHSAKEVIKAVCNALVTLHGMYIIHRDIKPENIMINTKGEVKLLDFNASRIHSIDKQTDTVVLGTIGYASPDQFGISQSDEKSDIYAVGVLLNVMLTGKHPSEALAKGKAGKIVLKCTQIDPKSRFKSVKKLVDAL